MSGSKTISNTTPAVGAVSIQQSSYGLVLPIVWGRTRITGNLLWYGDFKANPHTETTQSGGKGGAGGIRQSTTTYTYSAAVMMGLAEGPITGIRAVWRGKSYYPGIPVSNRIEKAVEVHSYAPTVTVSHTAAWTDVSVQVSAPGLFGNEVWVSLLRGVDYNASGGIYTINATMLTPAGTISMAGRDLQFTYTYSSADPSESALGAVGLDLTMGTPGQAPWSYLTSAHPTEAVGYSSVAYVMGADYSLTGNAEVENHAFEVDAPLQFSDVGDAIPSNVVRDFLSNPQYGAPFGSDKIGPLTDYTNACIAQGIFVSPALTQQSAAIDFLAQMAQITNCGLVWSEGMLKFVPYTDSPIPAHFPYYVGYTPNTAPIYDLTYDDFICEPGDDPVKIERSGQSDTYNTVKVEYLDRADFYNLAIQEAKDQADIQESGLRVMSTISAHWICDARVAKIVAQLILQRSMYIRNTYSFTVGWSKIALEPMDLVTITDPALGLDRQPVRIVTIDEGGAGELSIVAEEFPKGSASATLYPSGSGGGFSHNYNADPGNALAPVVFEAPVALAQSKDGLDIWLATGGGADYGGCEVWVSLTGADYQRVADFDGKSRFGHTTSAMAAHAAAGQFNESVGVSLSSGGQLMSGTAADLAQLTTLCYLDGEYIAYQAAALTGLGAYTLGPDLQRGAFLSPATSHASGVPFVRCDSGLAKFPLTADYIGKTIHIKLLAFNVYGGGRQQLADVPEYTYTITGQQANNPPLAPTGLSVEGAFTINTAKFKWDRIANAVSYVVQIWAGSTLAKVREVNVGDALRFDYSHEDALTDGGPWRALTCKVQGINRNGAHGAFASLAVNNPQVGALTGVSITPGPGYLQFNCAKPADADFAGVRIWISATAGFTPDATNLVFDGPATNVTIAAMPDSSPIAAGGSYYLKYAGYDSYDKAGLTIGSMGPIAMSSATGNQVANAYLYQWSTVLPSAPTGTSTFNWGTGVNSAYSGSDGWGATIPANSGVPGLMLYVALKPISAAIGTSSSTVNYAGANVTAWSQNGAPGAKSAIATAYQWSVGGAPTATGAATWTWATASYNTPPSGWSATKPAAPGQGYTLYEARVPLVDTAGSATSPINWTTASVSGISYFGTNGSPGSPGNPGSNGISAVVAYALVSGSPTISYPANVTAYGLPGYNSWGQGESWQSNVPVPGAGQSVFMSNGLLNPSTGQTTWNLPYLAALKVGNLAAISTNTGTLNVSGSISSANGNFSVDSAGNLYAASGTFKGDISSATGTFTNGININFGNFTCSSTGYASMFNAVLSRCVASNASFPPDPSFRATSSGSGPAISAIASSGDAVTASGPITASGKVTGNGGIDGTGSIGVKGAGTGTGYGGYFTSSSGAGLYCSGFQAFQASGTVVHLNGTGTAWFNTMAPNIHNTYDLGSSTFAWANCWVRGAVLNGSDRRIKTDIRDSDRGLAFINSLRARVYKMRVGSTEVALAPEQAGPGIDGFPIPQEVITTTKPGERDHYGLITQELRDALGTDNVAMWALADKDDPESAQYLIYSELIAPMIKAIQELSAEVDELKKSMAVA